MSRRFQFTLTALMLLAPAFVLGYIVGQKTAEESLEADRARVVKKDLELQAKEARIQSHYASIQFSCGTP